MKAIVIHQYGGPEELKFEDVPDPVAGPGEVLVRVAATSINPIDAKRRSGAAKGMFPIEFPGVIGVDVSGTVEKLGPGVDGFAVGDAVFAFADRTYAERCVVKAADLAKIPAGLDPIDAAALPLVTATGTQLITLGTDIRAGQTVLVAGAIGGVGRTAIFTAKERGAKVIAGVRRKQLAEGATLGADQVVAIDDDAAIAALPPLDAVADAVGGKTAAALLAKVKPGGVFGSVLGPPSNAKEFASVKVTPVSAKPDVKELLTRAAAVIAGTLSIPVDRRLPLRDAAQGHAAVEKGGIGKVLLVV